MLYNHLIIAVLLKHIPDLLQIVFSMQAHPEIPPDYDSVFLIRNRIRPTLWSSQCGLCFIKRAGLVQSILGREPPSLRTRRLPAQQIWFSVSGLPKARGPATRHTQTNRFSQSHHIFLSLPQTRAATTPYNHQLLIKANLILADFLKLQRMDSSVSATFSPRRSRRKWAKSMVCPSSRATALK